MRKFSSFPPTRNLSSSAVSMFPSRTKAINHTLSRLFRHFIEYKPSQQYHTFRPKRPTTESRREPPHRSTSRLRKRIPFLADLKSVQDPDDALSLFNQYQQMGFKHDYPSYSALVYKLARSRNFEAVETLLDYLQNINIRCRETLFIALIQHYGKSQMPEKAIELFQRMPSFNCHRTIVSFNTLLNVLVEIDRFLDAIGIFDRSTKMGFRRNSISFNIIIKGWLGKGEWDKAWQVFEEMIDKEVKPTVGDLDGAMGLLQDMIQKRHRPNAVTYALLMEGLCSLGKYKEAKKMMFDMDYQGCKPRLLNFGVLMSDLGRRGRIDDAKTLLLEMKRRRFKPDVVTYNILINYLCKEGRALEAYKVLVEMQVGGCEPNAATYRMMVDGFCQVEDFEGGLKVLSAMLMCGHCPRLESFCDLVVGLLKNGKIDGACFVLEEMEKRKMRFHLEAWEALVKDACPGDRGAGGLVRELDVQISGKKNDGDDSCTCYPVAPEASDLVETPVSSVTSVATAPAAATSTTVTNTDLHHTLSFFMHDILGGSNPSAGAVTGIVTNPAVNGQVPFAKPNGAVLPVKNGVPLNNGNSALINNNNIPFLTGLSGNTANVIQNNGNNVINGGSGLPVFNGGQFPAGTNLQKLMFGTMTVIDDELTEGHDRGSGLVGKAQGFYVASSEDGSSQTMAFTAMFESDGYASSLSFFGVHRTAVSESQLAIMGGTGKYVNAEGYATVKTIPGANQHNTDGTETLLQISVYLAH
ncbi:hypothetical protein AAG906_032721 [Vitis piasezkii]